MRFRNLIRRAHPLSRRSEPVPLAGEFDWGYSLGAYSEEGKRSEIGELIYQLKYRNDIGAAHPIADRICQFLATENVLVAVSLVTIVPASFTSRPFYSVAVVAAELATRLGLEYRNDLFIRKSVSLPQKRIRNRETKMRNLERVFALNPTFSHVNKGVFLLDDIFDSGATATYLTRLLREGGASLVAILTFGHTDFSPQFDAR